MGFSTHGETALIVDAIETGVFDYVNLHWYFIRQDNEPAIAAASLQDMGVFIISPTDKGGHLHTPGPRLLELTDPLHPIVFNDLFCLRDPRVHTLSVGAARPQDLDLHLEAVALLDQAADLVAPIESRFREAERDALGASWMMSWRQGLPDWQDTPGRSTCRCFSGCTTCSRPGIWRALSKRDTACWVVPGTGFQAPMPMPSTAASVRSCSCRF